jgi:CDP-diacylglycerol--serine O-phosphatidyltransferase
MLAVKWDILSYLKKPLHQRLFGANKTWRGFVIMPLATWPGVYIAQQFEILLDVSAPVFNLQSTVTMSLILGLAYCLAELPNSFIKRRLGVKEGQTSQKYKIFFIIFDQADSVIGCLVAYALMISLDALTIWGTLMAGTFIHLFFNYSLYLVKVRKNPL